MCLSKKTNNIIIIIITQMIECDILEVHVACNVKLNVRP